MYGKLRSYGLTKNRIKSSCKRATCGRRKRGAAGGESTIDQELYSEYLDLASWPVTNCVRLCMSKDELSRAKAGDSSAEDRARTRVRAALAAGYIDYVPIDGESYVNKVEFLAWLVITNPEAKRLAANCLQIERDCGETPDTEMQLLARIFQLDGELCRGAFLTSRDIEIRMNPKCRSLASAREMEIRLEVLELANELLDQDGKEFRTARGKVVVKRVADVISGQWLPPRRTQPYAVE